jgi:hypothetical protein
MYNNAKTIYFTVECGIFAKQPEDRLLSKHSHKVRLKSGVLDDDELLHSDDPLTLLSSEKVQEEDEDYQVISGYFFFLSFFFLSSFLLKNKTNLMYITVYRKTLQCVSSI